MLFRSETVAAPRDLDDQGPSIAPDLSCTKAIGLDAVTTAFMALSHNAAFNIQKLSPAVSKLAEDFQAAAFDTGIGAEVGVNQSDRDSISTRQRSVSADITATRFLETGTTLSAGAGLSHGQTDPDGASSSEMISATYEASVRQSLLRGRGASVNSASLSKAKLDTSISEQELRASASSLAADSVAAFWDYEYAVRALNVRLDAVKLADEQSETVRERIKAGVAAETDIVSADAEAALQRELLLNAQASLKTARLSLLRLLNATPLSWQGDFVTSADSIELIPADSIDAANGVEYAKRMRPEIIQAKLQLEQGRLELVKTKNGWLPKLDAFISLGGSTYADSFAIKTNVGSDLTISAGLTYDYTTGNRSARALDRQAQFNEQAKKEAIANIEQLIELDVRTAAIQVDLMKEKITASAATRALRETNHRIETERYIVGRATNLQLTEALQSLIESRLSELSARISYRKALISYYEKEGSLLTRLGIETGSAPENSMRLSISR